MPPRTTKIARLLAPLALVACALAVFLVVGGTLGSDDSSTATTAGDAADDGGTTATETTPTRPRRARYRVKSGDTLEAIADKTGVPVATLQELNPELDPQALVVGQRITLRE